MSAISRALLNPERLLEAILLQALLHGMTIPQLLRCQQVCRTWQRTIQQSAKLQKAMFRLPVSTPKDLQFFYDRVQHEKYDSTYRFPSSLKLLTVPGSITMHMLQEEGPDDNDYRFQAKHSGPDIGPLYANNLVARLPQFLPKMRHDPNGQRLVRKAVSQKLATRRRSDRENHAILQKWRYPNASFRSMLLSQPAATSVSIHIHQWSLHDSAYETPEICKQVRNKRGVTAGDVFDAAQKVYERVDADRSLLCWVGLEWWTEPETFDWSTRMLITATWKQHIAVIRADFEARKREGPGQRLSKRLGRLFLEYDQKVPGGGQV